MWLLAPNEWNDLQSATIHLAQLNLFFFTKIKNEGLKWNGKWKEELLQLWQMIQCLKCANKPQAKKKKKFAM